jgi:hypothetical protein
MLCLYHSTENVKARFSPEIGRAAKNTSSSVRSSSSSATAEAFQSNSDDSGSKKNGTPSLRNAASSINKVKFANHLQDGGNKH